MKVGQVLEVETLHDRSGVFADRYDAGLVLSRLVGQLKLQSPLVMAIPAGGVPVAAALAEALKCKLDVLVVSKITLPWDTEAGYGAVAFDGSYLLNEAMIKSVGLGQEEVARGIGSTREKVLRRVARFRKGQSMPALAAHDIIVVDDGLASGFTMHAALAALRRAGSKQQIVAVPTGHERAVYRLAETVERVCCANVRGGLSFAVASAYQSWNDVSEIEAEQVLSAFTEP